MSIRKIGWFMPHRRGILGGWAGGHSTTGEARNGGADAAHLYVAPEQSETTSRLGIKRDPGRDPRLARSSTGKNQLKCDARHRLCGRSEGRPTHLKLLKARNLLARGNDYTQAVVFLIVGAASLLLFFLTRRGFYAWFTVTMLLGTLILPLRLLSEHFGWGFFTAVYAYAVLDFLS